MKPYYMIRVEFPLEGVEGAGWVGYSLFNQNMGRIVDSESMANRFLTGEEARFVARLWEEKYECSANVYGFRIPIGKIAD